MADDKKVYVYDENMNREEGMTKEQIEEQLKAMKIEDITDTAVTFNTGFSKTTGFHLYKQGKRIFGSLNFAKSENWSAIATDIEIGTINYKPPFGLFTNMMSGSAFWDIGVPGYLAIESNGSIKVKVADVSKKAIRANIEFVIN